MSVVNHVLAHSCAGCVHFEKWKSGTRCWAYDNCKAGRPLTNDPPSFKAKQ